MNYYKEVNYMIKQKIIQKIGIKLKFILKQENYYMKQVKNMVKVLLNNLLLS